MELILVSDFSPIVNEHQLLNQLFSNGLEVFHLRKRDYTLQQMMDYIQAIPAEFHPRIVIHSHFQLLSYFNLKGVHFNKQYTLQHFKNEASEDLYNLVSLKHISLSVHSLNDILKLDREYNYVFISPVFDSISNRGYNAKIKIKTFQKFLETRNRKVKVIALGGIKEENIPLAFATGFDGVAMLGYIWNEFAQNKNVDLGIERFKQIQRLLKLVEYPVR
jgi:thiamine-phosphate pyrophosphorylase